VIEQAGQGRCTRERDEGVGIARHLRLALVHPSHGPHLAHRLPGDLQARTLTQLDRDELRPAGRAKNLLRLPLLARARVRVFRLTSLPMRVVGMTLQQRKQSSQSAG
jgi:hypothetical protein